MVNLLYCRVAKHVNGRGGDHSAPSRYHPRPLLNQEGRKNVFPLLVKEGVRGWSK